MTAASTTHDNHYVPIWYQKRFLAPSQDKLYRLDLTPPTIQLPGGHTKLARAMEQKAPKASFVERDLYTTVLGGTPNDEIERYLFGAIDNDGARAVRAFSENDLATIHALFQKFFEYLSAQKVRTPKGLDWIRSKYPELSQLDLMLEMQHLRQMHCTMWFESVREIVSAEASDVKFIVTDHPVTTYNPACPPGSRACRYPDDPPTAHKGTQTLFALDSDHCLILTNLEYAQDPAATNLMADRQNARYTGQTLTRTDAMVRTRKLTSGQVTAINHVLKARARRYVAAGDKAWLNPEAMAPSWQDIGAVLLPPRNKLWGFGGEIYIGHKDGSTQYQDAFGRTSKIHEHLRKDQGELPGPNDPCGCGSGRRFKKCCSTVEPAERPPWNVYSIRDRNVILINAVIDILGLSKGKLWSDVRRELSDEQVRRIHEVYQVGWPKDTNITELLPRPDPRVFRAVYMGLIDPRTIAASVTGWLPYFDEIVMVHPFANPNHIRPEYSPIEAPGRHKSQTLKNVWLLLALEPFIRAGMVHLIPDPGDVNFAFGSATLEMAKERGTNWNWKPTEEDVRIVTALSKDDLERATLRMPEDSLRRLIRASRPDIDTDLLERTVRFMKQKLVDDPFALLQPLPKGESASELQMQRGVSLELALFLAQSTGGAVYTDSSAHWKQLLAHTTAPKNEDAPSPWNELVDAAASLEYTTEIDQQINLDLRWAGELSYVRRCFRRVWNTVLHGPTNTQAATCQELSQRLERVVGRAAADWRACQSTTSSSQGVRWRMQLSIPRNGFTTNTVHRLLVTFGRGSHLKSIPIGIFIEPTGPAEKQEATVDP